MYTKTTRDIRISVSADFLTDSSLPEDDIYAFSYTVQIENLGDERVQILERHWIVTSGVTQMTEMAGTGLANEQPTLDRGEIFEFTSGTVIQDPIGFMEGSYLLRTVEGSYFEASVPKFDLTYPLVIH